MLSLRRCRELLPTQSFLSDEQVEILRGQFYAVAQLACEKSKHPRERVDLEMGGFPGPRGSVRAFEESVTEENLTEMEERAAIMEFDGNLQRADAERVAIALIFHRDDN